MLLCAVLISTSSILHHCIPYLWQGLVLSAVTCFMWNFRWHNIVDVDLASGRMSRTHSGCRRILSDGEWQSIGLVWTICCPCWLFFGLSASCSWLAKRKWKTEAQMANCDIFELVSMVSHLSVFLSLCISVYFFHYFYPLITWVHMGILAGFSVSVCNIFFFLN